MKNKQLTAVEWFASELAEILPMVDDIETANKLFNTYLKAKAMEKDQIIGTYIQGRLEGNNLPMSIEYMNLLDDAEIEALNYYNETYEQ